MYNPYLYNMNQYQIPVQQTIQTQPQQLSQQVIRVHGVEGAKAYTLPPNSSILLLDETQNVVWLKMTDGAGYPTISGYTITPLESQEKSEYSSLEERIKRIEEDLYAKSDIVDTKSK